MPVRPRKSPAAVSLVLIGAAALAGCGDNATSSRARQYPSREACVADWGDPRECEQQSSSGGGHGGGGTWTGGHGPGGGTGSSHDVTRGGFGASGGEHGGGG